MDQKRLFLAIAVSLAILLGFQMLVAPHLPKPPPQQIAQKTEHSAATPLEGAPGAAVPPAPLQEPRTVPRLKIEGTRVRGSIARRPIPPSDHGSAGPENMTG